MAWSPGFPSTYWEYHLLVLTLAWFAGFGFGTARGWSWPRSLGATLVAYPFARLAVGVWLSVWVVFEGGVAPPLSVAELWSKILWHSFWYVAVPGFGLLLVYERVPALARTPGRPGLLAGSSLAPVRGVATDTLAGAALFFGITLAYFLAVIALTTGLGSVVNTGDDSRVFDNVTPAIVLLLSLVAGVSEEFLFRGILQTRLTRLMPFWAANGLQATFFGLVHSGYGNLAHVLGPLVFGLGMGVVVRRLGILAAVVLHAGVDVVALGLSNVTVPVLFVFGGLVTANVYAALVLRGAPIRWLLGRAGPT